MPQDLPNELRLLILGDYEGQENVKTLFKKNYNLVPSPLPKIRFLPAAKSAEKQKLKLSRISLFYMNLSQIFCELF